MTEEEFNGFFAANFTDVWGFARRRTDSGSDADDVTAETFAVAWRRRTQIPSVDGRLWLFGVARNVLANHRRATQRRLNLHLRLATVQGEPVAYQPDGLVWEALAELSEDDRELLLMRAWDGLSVLDIATVLDITAANVSSRLYRARARLLRELERRDSPDSEQVRTESRGKGSDR
ncbi:RNA polymerase sigma factor [Couchioplanes caeruleus]|uniref:RNA polymerase sigma factor n=1 Tax=Couchioplanes caeruleus TaxID=56438 RepID=UPI0020C173F8|nr:RNA polymerase sigma factor [Couchioplanes caeruleus]UQU65870.1 RNA polymerase sigma factor [Couchioplanes caeruleus]